MKNLCVIVTLTVIGTIQADQVADVLTTKPVRRSTAQIMQGEVVAPSRQPIIPASGNVTPGVPFIAQHFTVADYQETGQYGPSAESSVGSKQVLVASKGRVRSFSKMGSIDNVLNLTHDAFYSPISFGGFTADPNVIFHPLWKRWIVFGNAFLFSSLVLAISDGDPITSKTVWTFVVVDQSFSFSSTAFFDYTTLGADDQAIYCAANIIDNNDFTSAAAYVIPKTSFMEDTATIYAFRDLNSKDRPIRPFTYQPALNFDQNPSAGYFASIDWNEALTNGASNILVSVATFDQDSVPTLSDPIAVPVESYVQPLIVNALGTPKTHPIAPVAGFRLAPAHVRNNRLWLAYNISTNNTGVSQLPACIPPAGSLTRDAVRFTQIDVTKLDDPGDAVVSEGTLFQRTDTNVLGERSFLTPSIMSNAKGTVLIGATVCGERERLNAAVAQLKPNNKAAGPVVAYTDTTGNYDATEDWEFIPFARWGDHTRVSPDPEDDAVFWTAQQWCSQDNTWGLEVAQVLTQ